MKWQYVWPELPVVDIILESLHCGLSMFWSRRRQLMCFLGNRQNQRFRSCVSICHILRKTVKLSEISDALFYWYLSVCIFAIVFEYKELSLPRSPPYTVVLKQLLQSINHANFFSAYDRSLIVWCSLCRFWQWPSISGGTFEPWWLIFQNCYSLQNCYCNIRYTSKWFACIPLTPHQPQHPF